MLGLFLFDDSESLAKMRLAAFATGRDIDEALRLFKGSTMAAASAGALSGVEGLLLYFWTCCVTWSS